MSELNVSNLRKEHVDEGPDLVGVTELTSPYFMVAPSGSTAERPKNPQSGQLRFNTDSGGLEYFRGNDIGWESIDRVPPATTGGRAFVFGMASYPAPVNSIDMVTFQSTGGAIDWGDLTTVTGAAGACADSVRGVRIGGVTSYPGTFTNVIDYFSLATQGDAVDYGDLGTARRGMFSFGDRTRGGVAGGATPSYTATSTAIDYITIQSQGNTTSFGNLSSASGNNGSSSWGNQTRGLFGAISSNAHPAAPTNTIEYITIQTTGNSVDFGDMNVEPDNMLTASNSIRGISAGGYESPTPQLNSIEYCTIATTGNFADFGDLTFGLVSETSGAGSPTRAIFNRGIDINYIHIMSLGNSIDFGDLTVQRDHDSMLSNVHGGLG